MLLRVPDLAGTHRVAAAIAALSRPGDLIVLAGEMGAGKTAFAQGFGRALGVSQPVTSPTFTLVHSYPVDGRLTLHHADLYRLDRTADVYDLALHELGSTGIVLVEWGDVAAAALGDHLEVRLSRVEPTDDDADDEADVDADGALADDSVAADEALGDEQREIELRSAGSAWSGRWARLCASLEEFRC